MKKVRKFLKDIKKELSRVKWPKKEDMLKFGLATLTLMLFVGLFYTFIDVIIAFVIKYI